MTEVIGSKTCGNCKHRQTNEQAQDQCQRFPPTVSFFVLGFRSIPDAPPEVPKVPIMGQHCGYPPVEKNWPACGEHAVRLAIRND